MNNKKKNIKGILYGGITAIITIALIIVMGFFVTIRISESYYNIDEMYESDDIDVLFIGNSHSIAGIYCDVFDENTGANSFNLSTTSQSPFSAELLLEETLKNHDIDVVFVETFSMVYPSKKDFYYSKAMEADMTVIRSIRNPALKLKGILSQSGMRNIFDGFLPMFKYHANWKKPEKWHLRFWDVSYTLEDRELYTEKHHKGSRYIPYVMTPDQYEGYDNYEYTFDVDTSMKEKQKHWDNIIEMCDKKDVEVVFVTVPWLDKFVESTNYGDISSAFNEYFISKNTAHIDMNEIDLSLTYEDFAQEDPNPNQHLNISGATKVSEYISFWSNDNIAE